MRVRTRCDLMRRTAAAFALVAAVACHAPAAAGLNEGDLAPNFTKTDLNGVSHSLSNYLGKVVVLFLFGYNCPVCNAQGNAFETGVWQWAQSNHPGQVVVLGADVWNGSVPQVHQFRINTGATYPLLLQAGDGPGNENLNVPYNEFDNYVVINKQGVIRYHAWDRWPHGNRQHLDEIRATVDSLVTNLAGVGDGPAASLALAAAPNPFHGSTVIELSSPFPTGTRVRAEVFDLAGRRVARLWEGPVASGITRLRWDGRSDAGVALGPGVYLVAVDAGGRRVTRRVVRAQ